MVDEKVRKVTRDQTEQDIVGSGKHLGFPLGTVGTS